MIKATAKFVMTTLICLALVVPAFGQEGSEITYTTGPRQQLATIVFAGLGGAILGLSTLSFYGRPQDKLSNIAIGFAIGVIGGAIYTTYQTATQPYKEFESVRNMNFDHDYLKLARYEEQNDLGLAYSWSF